MALPVTGKHMEKPLFEGIRGWYATMIVVFR
jgi:hypothetical protein